jgi:hypothetical protein
VDDTFETPPEQPARVRYRTVAALPALGDVPRGLAVDDSTGAEVELAEYLDLVDADRLQEVASGYRAVESPFVAPILELVPARDGAGVVTVELHPGGPRLSAATPLARRDAVLAGADAAAGVAALHDAGLLHGAVGPDAVVLAGGSRPVLVGAGTPLLAAAGREELPPTRTADDLHGLGVVLHQLLVGTPPADPPVPPVRNVPDLEPSLNGLILALLSRDPDRPPPPAGAVARRLRALATDAPRPPVVTTATRVADGIERGLAELAVYALFAALALVGVVAAYAATREEDAPPVATVTVSTPGLATLQPPPTVPLSTTPVATDPGPDEDGIVTETSVQTVGSVATVTATETVTSTQTVTDVQTTTAPTTTTG